jgi:Fe2+ transport system protein FeoA
MKIILIRLTLILFVCGATSLSSHAQVSEVPLTNNAVVKLVRAGFKEKTVIAIIHSRPNRFVLDPDRLIELKRGGVSENIILAMLAQDGSFVFGDDDWGDSAFGSRKGGSIDGNNNGQTGTDIFGSGSGSHSQSSGRGTRGGNTGETNTTGSATVRILRPPTEAGGSSLKLERSPTLTNDSVIKLVEAGFSEGTIIKRIEESPAEFDLAAPRLEELRRRRVTDAIITAMTLAMGEDSSPKQDASAPGKAKGN